MQPSRLQPKKRNEKRNKNVKNREPKITSVFRKFKRKMKEQSKKKKERKKETSSAQRRNTKGNGRYKVVEDGTRRKSATAPGKQVLM